MERREAFGEDEGEDRGEVRSGLELVELEDCEGGSSSDSFRGDCGGVFTGEVGVVVVVLMVMISMGKRIGKGAGSTVGLVRKGQLERFVVRKGLKPEIFVGLFGDVFGEVFGEFATNLKESS